ncbi:ABC transporter permease [Haloarchaeobius sp. FL176]|uniref:ABC transporter permease n=1 Tax=Haloarchaeobius sp. FL176 TaxID=2967129 RepID=UPI0021472615|nr:ABC transporter permease [Haloarchaeobius sp. FL176]
MRLATIARDDFTNARRSSIVLAVIGVFTLLVAMVFASEYGIYDEPYRTLFDVSAFVSFVFPLFLAPLAYLSIAGDRMDGTIKYVMGLPNSRAEYFFGKFASRLSVATAAVVLGMVVSFVIALATYVQAPSVERFAVFTGVSLVYTVSFVSIFVAISAAASSRSRAMFGALGAYFVFVVFWFGFFPVINLGTILDTVESLLGVTVSENTRSYVQLLSPATAYLQSTEPVYSGVFDQYQSFQLNFQPESDKLHDQTWFAVLVMLAWSAVSLAVGYLSFRRSELG